MHFHSMNNFSQCSSMSFSMDALRTELIKQYAVAHSPTLCYNLTGLSSVANKKKWKENEMKRRRKEKVCVTTIGRSSLCMSEPHWNNCRVKSMPEQRCRQQHRKKGENTNVNTNSSESKSSNQSRWLWTIVDANMSVNVLSMHCQREKINKPFNVRAIDCCTKFHRTFVSDWMKIYSQPRSN